jgi:hypothetical protein
LLLIVIVTLGVGIECDNATGCEDDKIALLELLIICGDVEIIDGAGTDKGDKIVDANVGKLFIFASCGTACG